MEVLGKVKLIKNYLTFIKNLEKNMFSIIERIMFNLQILKRTFFK